MDVINFDSWWLSFNNSKGESPKANACLSEFYCIFLINVSQSRSSEGQGHMICFVKMSSGKRKI